MLLLPFLEGIRQRQLIPCFIHAPAKILAALRRQELPVVVALRPQGLAPGGLIRGGNIDLFAWIFVEGADLHDEFLQDDFVVVVESVETVPGSVPGLSEVAGGLRAAD